MGPEDKGMEKVRLYMTFAVKSLAILFVIVFITGVILMKKEYDGYNFLRDGDSKSKIPKNKFIEINNYFPGDVKKSNRQAELEIYIDLSVPEKKSAFITMIFNNPGSNFTFESFGGKMAFEFENVNFYNEKKKPLSYLQDGSFYHITPAFYKKIFIQYEVKPGGFGRHERQGNISENFACFDGRVFIISENFSKIKSALIRFNVPSGWQIITPHRREGDYYYPDYFGEDLVYLSILKSSMVFGPFDESRKTFGNTALSVYTYSDWQKIHKKIIRDKTFRIYEYFFKKFGLDPGGKYVVSWVPLSSDERRVFCGMWSNSQCFEMPEDILRNWKLFVHRLTHVMNAEKPAAMTLKDNKDTWTVEGWPCYNEIEITSSLGMAIKSLSWDLLYRQYVATLKEHPEWDCPVADEAKTEGAQREFIHYCKEPLVFKMLDYEIKKRSGKNIEDFMAYAYRKYGFFKEPFPFKEELENYSGVSFDDFWDNMIKKNGKVIPVWKEGKEKKERRRRGR